jgi:hypothetical protein
VQITDLYIKLPIVQRIDIVSSHPAVTNGLPAQDGAGIKNFYLNAGAYYATPDSITIEIEVNNREYLRNTDSVELITSPLGGSVGANIYIPKSEFVDANSNIVRRTIKLIQLVLPLLLPHRENNGKLVGLTILMELSTAQSW